MHKTWLKIKQILRFLTTLKFADIPLAYLMKYEKTIEKKFRRNLQPIQWYEFFSSNYVQAKNEL